MTPRRRARREEVAQRINAALELLRLGLNGREAIRRLAVQEGLSERQARRYLQRAQSGGPVEIPGPQQVFTVKLPTALVRRLREYARTSRRTLSSLVAQALEEFLGKAHAGRRGGRSTR